MPCNHPMFLFDTGLKTETGKRLLIISKSSARMSPSFVSKKIGCPFPRWLDPSCEVPCGHCAGCRSATAKEWSRRCVVESGFWRFTWFVTLTYDDFHRPGKLVKKDLQDFFKRLRHQFDFKYFGCGEFGDHTHREHYHVLLFTDFDLRSKCGKALAPNSWGSPWLSAIWSKGFAVVERAEPASISYVCGYCQKKLSGPEEGFRVMSRRPGIGLRDILPGDPVYRIYGDFGRGVFSVTAPRAIKTKSGVIVDDLFKVGERQKEARRVYDLQGFDGFSIDDFLKSKKRGKF